MPTSIKYKGQNWTKFWKLHRSVGKVWESWWWRWKLFMQTSAHLAVLMKWKGNIWTSVIFCCQQVCTRSFLLFPIITETCSPARYALVCWPAWQRSLVCEPPLQISWMDLHWLDLSQLCGFCLAAIFSMWASSTNILDGRINLSIWATLAPSQIYIDPAPPNIHYPLQQSTLPVHKVVALNARERCSKVEVISLDKSSWLWL